MRPHGVRTSARGVHAYRFLAWVIPQVEEYAFGRSRVVEEGLIWAGHHCTNRATVNKRGQCDAAGGQD